MTRAAALGEAFAEPPPAPAAAGCRRRLLAATVTTVAERGYARTTPAQIAAAAGLPPAEFEHHFKDKEDCFLTAYDRAVDLLEQWIAATLAARPAPWPERVRAVVESVVETLVADPSLARFCAVEALSAGPRARERHNATVGHLAALLREGREHCAGGKELPPDLERSLVGGAILSLGGRADPRAGSGRIAAMAPEIVYFLLAPYLGVAAARLAAGID